ncbi:hypothetical protein PANA5342_pPANA10171 (plasmid) [Pantoea ananatis LMG 5342]|nr:hypothetical protein PANA5342_pPANA10171 [Pantoea ananatis LMG 5342]
MRVTKLKKTRISDFFIVTSLRRQKDQPAGIILAASNRQTRMCLVIPATSMP